MDKFFTKKHCDRCGARLGIYRMSRINDEVICEDCATKERDFPDYNKRVQEEVQAVKSGNYNFFFNNDEGDKNND